MPIRAGWAQKSLLRNRKRWLNRMTTIKAPPLHRVALYQAICLLLISGALALNDRLLALSVLIGGLIQIIPQAWFARQAYRFSGARQVDLIVRAMYLGESGKIILTAVLFVSTFVLFKQLNFLALMIAFVLMIPVQWFLTLKVLKY